MISSILVTGAQGQIGRMLVRALTGLKYEVFELDCLPGEGNQYLHYDLLKDNLEVLRLKKFDVLVHLAGDKSDPPITKHTCNSVFQANVVATARLLDVIKDNVNQIIYASSISVYGDAGVPYGEEQSLQPRTLYGASKAAAEMLFRCYGVAERTSILRIAQVIGQGTPEHVAPIRMITAAKKGKVQLACTNATVRDYVHLEDVVQAIISAIRLRISGVFNIGSGRPTALPCLASYIAKSAGVPLEQTVPASQEFEIWMSTKRARAHLGYEPSWTVEQWVKNELQTARHQPIQKKRRRTTPQRTLSQEH